MAKACSGRKLIGAGSKSNGHHEVAYHKGATTRKSGNGRTVGRKGNFKKKIAGK